MSKLDKKQKIDENVVLYDRVTMLINDHDLAMETYEIYEYKL